MESTKQASAIAGELLTQKEAAAALRCHFMTLTKQRREGRGIPFIKLGHKVFYRRSDIETYIDSCYVNHGKAA